MDDFCGELIINYDAVEADNNNNSHEHQFHINHNFHNNYGATNCLNYEPETRQNSRIRVRREIRITNRDPYRRYHKQNCCNYVLNICKFIYAFFIILLFTFLFVLFINLIAILLQLTITTITKKLQ